MADNNIDPEEVRRLNEAFKELSDIVSGHVTAMKASTQANSQYTSALKSSSKRVETGSEVLKKAGDDFRDQMKQNGKVYDRTSKSWVSAQEKEISLLSESQKIKYDELQATRKTLLQEAERNKMFSNELRALGMTVDAHGKLQDISVKLTDSQKELLAKAKEQKEKIDAINKLYGLMSNKLVTLLKAYDVLANALGDTLFKLEGGMEKYGSVLKKAGSSVQEFASEFGPVGKVIGFLLGNLIKLAGVALEMSANLVKAQDELAKFGGNIGLTTDEFYELGRRVGYSSENLAEFAKKLSAAGPALAALGNGSVSEGIKRFAAIGKITEEQRESYRRLGLSQEDLVESQADYLGLQASYGARMNKSVATLQRESLAYAENLTALSALTGESKEELKKKQQAAANDLRFQLKIQELQEGSAADQALAQRMQKNNAEIQARLGDNAAKAYREVATKGFTNSEEGLALIRATRGASVQMFKDMDKGTLSVANGAKQIAQMKDSTNKALGGALYLGKNAELFGNDIEAQRKRQIAASGKSLEQTYKEIDAKKRAGDLTLDTEGKRQSAEISARQAMDSLAMTIQKDVLSMLKNFSTVMNALAKGIAKFATWLGAPDFTHLFESTEEIKARIDETAGKIQQNQTRIDRASKYMAALDNAKDPEAKKKATDAIRAQGAEFFQADADRQLKEATAKGRETADLKEKFEAAKKANASPAQIAELQTQYEKAEADSKRMMLQASNATNFAKQLAQDFKNGVASIDDKVLYERIKAIKDSGMALNKVLEDANTINKRQYLAKDKAIRDDDVRLLRFVEQQDKARASFEQMKKAELKQAGYEKDADLDEAAEDSAAEKERKKRARARILELKDETNVYLAQIEEQKKQLRDKLEEDIKTDRSKYSESGAKPTGTASEGGGSNLSTLIKGDDGKGEKRVGGTVSWRNNNPGNLRYTPLTQSYGAVGKAHGFAVFPDKKTGDEARRKLLFESGVYKDMNLDQMIHKYAPESDNNDTKGYLNHLVNALGVDKNTSLSSLKPEQRQKLLDAMEKKEGWKAGSIEKAAKGGIFSGPESGYPVILHGNEAVVPMSASRIDKQSLDMNAIVRMMADMPKNANNNAPQAQIERQVVVDNGLTMQLVDMLSSKLDVTIDKLTESNSIQDKLLKYTRA